MKQTRSWASIRHEVNTYMATSLATHWLIARRPPPRPAVPTMTPPPDWVTPVVQQDIEDQIIAMIAALQFEANMLGGCP